jgi:transmembrane sensor
MGEERDIDADRGTAEQAAEWIARLDSQDCTDAEREAFERWRTADPVHAVAYRHAEDMWHESSVIIRDSLALSEAARRALLNPPERSAARRWWLPAAAFAAMAAIALVAFVYWPLTPAEAPTGTHYATVTGERRSVTLEDGSLLTLDTQTVLVERYSPHKRRVDLQQGQAQFEVQGNPNRPFIVHAQGGTVTAVGTRFQVRVTATGATVTLLKGEVHVATQSANEPKRTVSLLAGQSLHFDADGTLGDVQAANLKATEGWLEGKLYVDNWRLQNFVAELNRYSDTQFRIDDPALRKMRISGVFQTRNRDNLERLLAQGWGIQSRKVAPNQILLTRQ